MIKKLFSFIFCMAPAGAMAAMTTLEPNPDTGTIQQDGLTVAAGDVTVLQSSATKTLIGLSLGADGLDVANDVIIGTDNYIEGGNLAVSTNVQQSGFTLQSSGPMKIGNQLLVNPGYNAVVTTNGTGTPASVTIGTAGTTTNAVINYGGLAFTNIGAFVANGNINNAAGASSLAINAASVQTNSILNNSGAVNIVSAGAVNVKNGGTVISAGNATETNITGASIDVAGDVNNQVGEMNLTATGGGITIGGALENVGTGDMLVDASGAIKVTSAVLNTDRNATMTIKGASLSVDGTDSATNSSFVNAGNLEIVVTGATTLANGFNLNNMDATNNTFKLTTGTLDVGGTTNWVQLFSNRLDSFHVKLTSGGINQSVNIINGMSAGLTNTNASMELAANSITANTVVNAGNNLKITTDTGAVTLNGNVYGNRGTTLIAAATDLLVKGGATYTDANGNTITTTGAVINESGSEMTLSGNKSLTAASVSNDGTLSLESGMDDGTITITSAVNNNAGTTTISALNINLTGIITNNGGTLDIHGTQNKAAGITLGTLSALGGAVNLAATTGTVDVTGAMETNRGTINLDQSVARVNVAGQIATRGDVVLANVQTSGDGAINIGGAGVQDTVLAANSVTIGGSVVANQNDAVRKLQFDADTITVDQDVLVSGLSKVIFGAENANTTTIKGQVVTNIIENDVGTVEFYGNEVTVGSIDSDGKIIAHGGRITATDADGIVITDNIIFDGMDASTGLIINGTNNFTLDTKNQNGVANPDGGSIKVGGASLGQNRTLNLLSNQDVDINGRLTTLGAMNINANGNVTIADKTDVKNTNGASLDINAANITMADLTAANAVNLVATSTTVGKVNANSGAEIYTKSDTLAADAITVNSGATMTVESGTINVGDRVTVAGNVVQGATGGALNLVGADAFTAKSLDVTGTDGGFNATAGATKYTFTDAVNIAQNMTVASGASVDMAASTILVRNIDNDGVLKLAAANGITAGVISNTDSMVLDSGTGLITATSVTSGGILSLSGLGLTTANSTFTQAKLYQNYNSDLNAGDVNIISKNYTITNAGTTVDDIIQKSGTLTLYTSDLTVGGEIAATDLYVRSNPAATPLTVGVGGNVSGGVKFMGLGRMSVGGDYTFDSNSKLLMNIENPDVVAGRNYWGTVDEVGLIKLPDTTNNEPMISVSGHFINALTNTLGTPTTGPLSNDQIGITLTHVVDQGTAIWLMHAEKGIEELDRMHPMRNVKVRFCNNTGTMCFDYYANKADGAYLAIRDNDNNGVNDSLYIVFDPNVGGPVVVFPIGPDGTGGTDYTKGEETSADAINNLIAGQLQDVGFDPNSPIEAIPVAFEGTNLEEMANELFKRIEYFTTSRDSTGLARFSRLFQPREIEQIAGSVVLNEHTSFRDFEDHMLDEFIWNRNRNLRKAWGEFDFGRFSQDVMDNKTVSGNRFSFTGGYDWQATNTLILGLAARVSHMSADNNDSMNLGYRPGEFIPGYVKLNVADTDFGVGAYALKTFSNSVRGYANAFLDLHWLDVSREQNYVAKIDGDGTAFSIISELGVMHDILNQYIVGNAYARLGYNFGFSVTEKSGGDDYMNLESDGYAIVTPGYSLIAQKRIYPSAWFQIRPYASIGVEYDVIGAPDKVQYKFAPAKKYTKYDVEIDPLWANIGGGMEFLSAMGWQFGLDYRYQYNTDIRLHNVKVSGLYRF